MNKMHAVFLILSLVFSIVHGLDPDIPSPNVLSSPHQYHQYNATLFQYHTQQLPFQGGTVSQVSYDESTESYFVFVVGESTMSTITLWNFTPETNAFSEQLWFVPLPSTCSHVTSISPQDMATLRYNHSSVPLFNDSGSIIVCPDRFVLCSYVQRKCFTMQLPNEIHTPAKISAPPALYFSMSSTRTPTLLIATNHYLVMYDPFTGTQSNVTLKKFDGYKDNDSECDKCVLFTVEWRVICIVYGVGLFRSHE
eukprot:PhF_6_TR41277/c0_g1_i2/m.62418